MSCGVLARLERLKYGSAILPITVMALCFLGILSFACSSPNKAKPEPVVIMTITTSLADSGLMDEITKQFKAQPRGYAVKVVAVGSGQALAMAKKGEADIVIAHDPKAEAAFLSEKKEWVRIPLMTSRFVLLGPDKDLAKTSGSANSVEAFKRIAAAKALLFQEETNQARILWKRLFGKTRTLFLILIGIKNREAEWELLLRLADELGAYILSDFPTYAMNRSSLALKIVLDNDPRLVNPYSILVAELDANTPEKLRL
jgi:tungstate transport system substrate-binding protein